MERNQAIRWLVDYALERGLVAPEEARWAVNALLEALGLDSYAPPEEALPAETTLAGVLGA